MILRRILQHLANQNWLAVCIDLVVVVVGVFIGIQVANWNDARLEAVRKEQIIESLITNINDSINVQKGFIAAINSGLLEWEESYSRGDRPSLYYFRIDGSDTAPDTWGVLQQTQLVDLFDPVTLFDLSFFYSELAGVGRKYVRYVTFVEEHVLPYAEVRPEIFYETNSSSLKPVYQANLERLREFSNESQTIINWANCIVFRLKSERTFDATCRRAGYFLDGMTGANGNPER